MTQWVPRGLGMKGYTPAPPVPIHLSRWTPEEGRSRPWGDGRRRPGSSPNMGTPSLRHSVEADEASVRS